MTGSRPFPLALALETPLLDQVRQLAIEITIIAMGLAGAGLIGLRRRDVG